MATAAVEYCRHWRSYWVKIHWTTTSGAEKAGMGNDTGAAGFTGDKKASCLQHLRGAYGEESSIDSDTGVILRHLLEMVLGYY